MGDPGAGQYWKKGDKDPDFGKPHKHAREKIRLMMMEASREELSDTLWLIAEKYPVEVLAALVEVVH